eukprot:TRINITY_DN21885_c0_g1_i1.p3 TRINITY_DN21885_c0_g1~~TRINITY_DN21885_c0_g1_i1.p3  ORF type:complete len:228 (+),score=24.81 TRINITY_DN21885_c0_g1_i1:296-979(+)
MALANAKAMAHVCAPTRLGLCLTVETAPVVGLMPCVERAALLAVPTAAVAAARVVMAAVLAMSDGRGPCATSSVPEIAVPLVVGMVLVTQRLGFVCATVHLVLHLWEIGQGKLVAIVLTVGQARTVLYDALWQSPTDCPAAVQALAKAGSAGVVTAAVVTVAKKRVHRVWCLRVRSMATSAELAIEPAQVILRSVTGMVSATVGRRALVRARVTRAGVELHVNRLAL